MTLNDLAAAMRGMPRHGRIVVKLPDGTLRDVTMVRGRRFRGQSGLPVGPDEEYWIILQHADREARSTS